MSGKLKFSSIIFTARIPYGIGIGGYKPFTSAQSICEPMGSNLDILYKTSKLDRHIVWNLFVSFSKYLCKY